MAQTRPPPHRQLSRLQMPPPLDTGAPAVPDSSAVFGSQTPTSFQPVLSPQMFNFQNGGIPPQSRAFPPHLNLHRPRPSFIPANIPLPPTPGVAVPPNFPVPGPPFGQLPGVGPQGSVPGRPFHPRRSASISIGGPPKAVLGGPRKPDPPPANEGEGVTGASSAAGPSQVHDSGKPKSKRCTVKLPVETLTVDGVASTSSRPPWARYPISNIPREEEPIPLLLEEVSTAEVYPEILDRKAPLPAIELLLPPKGAWETYRNRVIEEKLARLGVERGSQGVNIFVPGHAQARATSISSPADPALLLFKLNKLQQTQTRSILASPQSSDASLVSVAGSASHHGYSKSVAPAPVGAITAPGTPSVSGSQFISPRGANMPDLSAFGSSAHLTGDLTIPGHLKRSPLIPSSLHSVSETDDESEDLEEGDKDGGEDDEDDSKPLPIFAPQPKTPIQASVLQPEPPPRPEPNPDFTVGFDLDNPSDDESRPATFGKSSQSRYALPPMDTLDLTEFGRTLSGEAPSAIAGEDDVESEDDDGMTEGAFVTPSHSRHASRAAANHHIHHAKKSGSSLRNFTLSQSDPHTTPRQHEDGEESDEKENIPPSQDGSIWDDDMNQGVSTEDWTNPSLRPERSSDQWTNPDAVAVNENGDTESTGEWSNPSDEERHRNERAELRLRREARTRRADEYGQPPSASIDSTFGVSHQLPRELSDDIISNPSDEGVHAYVSATEPALFSGSKSEDDIRSSRPLPLPPGSEGHTVAPTPTMPGGHSRTGSGATVGLERLNPLAKPFIFGAPLGGEDHSPQADLSAQPRPIHVRQESLSRLNAAASEFKPTFATSSSFDFDLPPGVPSLSFVPSIETQRTLPIPPSSPRAVQGREKRQRRGSSSGFGSIDATQLEQFVSHWEEDASGARFETATVAHTEPAHPMSRRGSILNPAAKPFVFGGPPIVPIVAKPAENAWVATRAAQGRATPSSAPATIPASLRNKRSTDDLEDVEPRPLTDAPTTPVGSPDRNRRAQIPGFRHPVSTNTVPASVFKALTSADGDLPTRPTVRSRLGSREQLFDGHVHQSSLDDINLPSIARRVQTSIRRNEATRLGSPLFDVFSQSPKGRSPYLGLDSSTDFNQPSGRLSSFRSSNHEPDVPFDVEALTDRLSNIINDKFLVLRRELNSRPSPTTPSDEVRKSLIEFIPVLESKVQSLLSDHRKNVADDTADARGELDYEMINNLIEQGHHDLRASLQRDIAEVSQALERQPQTNHQTFQLIEDLASRTIDAIDGNSAKIVAHFETREQATRGRSSEEQQQAIVQELLSHLLPKLESLHREPFNLELTTSHLSQAVRPHISQLIDLASDKKETASLITKELRPLLESLVPPTDNLEHALKQMPLEFSKVVPQLDIQVLKDAVAGSVLERLHARLAEFEESRVHDESHQRLQSAATTFRDNSTNIIALLQDLASQGRDLVTKHDSLQSNHADLVSKLISLPSDLASASAAITQAQGELNSKAQALTDIKGLQAAVEQNAVLQQELANLRNTLSDVESEKASLIESSVRSQTELETSSAELAKLRKTHESQEEALQQAKATASKREESVKGLRRDLEQTKNSLREKEKEAKSFERKENDARYASEKLRGKLADTESKLQVALNDLKHSEASADTLTKERAALVAQQSHWSDLKRTAEHVESLRKLLDNQAKQEAQEAQRLRDRTNVLEGELSTLQKLHSDQEKKLVASAQQRASEFEKNLKEREQELQNYAYKLEQSEASRKETTEELETLKTQLQEYEGNLRAGQERETQLQTQNAALERELAGMKDQLRTPYASYPTPAHSWHSTPGQNMPMPSIHSQDISYPSRSGTVVSEQVVSEQGQPETVWSSMHAPVEPPPTPRPVHQTLKRQIYVPPVSPTGSTISLAPTLGEDGWYS